MNALFSGPSGMGRTLTAEVMAGAFGMDLFRVDLAGVVSKWGGALIVIACVTVIAGSGTILSPGIGRRVSAGEAATLIMATSDFYSLSVSS